MPATIKDVAKESGVSVSTVSRWLTGGPVSTHKREKIQLAVQKLNFVSNGAARSLVTKKTYTLGVLLPDMYGGFYSEILRGLDQTAQERGYHLLVSSSHNEQKEIVRAIQAMQGRVDGLVVMSPDIDAASLQSNLPARLPIVLLNCYVEGDAYDSINVDNYGGAYSIVRHLTRLGHRRIALITGSLVNHEVCERLRGYEDALRDAGIAVVSSMRFVGDFNEPSGHRGALALLQFPERPTAIFAMNDGMAIGAMAALRTLGLRVPEEIAIVGFDDIPTSQYLEPPLTSVHVPIFEMGQRAMERLLMAIQEANAHIRRQEKFPTSLVIRRSCGIGQEFQEVTTEM
ncbi:MAG: LacI family DNA-binding transcriptional regulator [Bacteroidetes Order II. Incertae sedis bacterium]|nr:LacI family DNA-binding transcriptional regulator [Bacteroidetes Order II. bacterium]